MTWYKRDPWLSILVGIGCTIGCCLGPLAIYLALLA